MAIDAALWAWLVNILDTIGWGWVFGIGALLVLNSMIEIEAPGVAKGPPLAWVIFATKQLLLATLIYVGIGLVWLAFGWTGMVYRMGKR